MTLLYYLDRWSNETSPCDGTIEAWADWLSRPDPASGRFEAARDGDRFDAMPMLFEDDIVADRGASGWTFSRPVGDVHFLAVRWGEDMGWSPDNIVWGEDMEVALREWFVECDFCCEDREFIAVGRYLPKVNLTYRAEPVPVLVPQTIQ